MKVKKLNVIDFRHIKDQTIEFGERLTVITGQNGTWKSSILGWIAQACDFKPNIKTLNGNTFKSKYSEIFRFCKENDFSNKYTVSLIYEENNQQESKTMKTRYEKTEERFRVDFDGRWTAINFPVIYLGLKRLIPLATEKNISLKEIDLDSKEIAKFSRLAKEILILIDNNISSEGIKSTNKEILTIKTEKYGHLGNSAGQDNIGQIISSILSFEKLKKTQNSYKGGLLLIDEIDATLYAWSQIHLINKLYTFAKANDVQIIFTTHSLEILEHLTEKLWEETKINFLELRDNTIKNKLNPSIKFLRNKIKVQTGQESEIKQIEVVCEDKEAELWCKNLLTKTSYKKFLNIKEGPFGHGSLSKMAESKHAIFNNVFFVLDGDCKKDYKNKTLPPRTIILPGNRPPEIIFYKFLSNLSDEDPFWIENDNLNFSKQICFQYCQSQDLSTVKRWFNDETLKPLFGGTYKRLFDRWKKDNQDLVEKFQEEFEKMIKKE